MNFLTLVVWIVSLGEISSFVTSQTRESHEGKNQIRHSQLILRRNLKVFLYT